jgi:tetratricopeptide (TPR) repeat protein
MAKIALRSYYKEIESLIDQGHLEEAAAHCQHILKTYPKYLDVYRLLGKAYLEAHRYTEAADIFQRVLLSTPDDFICNLGLSIIRDEESNLDVALWHMERAFEAQPSNAGVQAELRRLYGRRDGMEPPKIRLTKGALAQMYAKGGQFNQALAEIDSVLKEEPERLDMLALQARVFLQAGRKADAVSAATELLKKYPYCLEANRVMVESGAKVDEIKLFRQRVNALDPYAALVEGSVYNAAQVADAAVGIDRLNYDPDAQPPSQHSEWASAGFSTPQASTTPDWLTNPTAEQRQTGSLQAEQPAAEPTSAEDIPDWLKSAGWGPSSGEFQEGPVNFDEEDESPAAAVAAELAQGDLPDWLQSMAPPVDVPSVDENAAAEVDEDFLRGLEAAAAGTNAPAPHTAPVADDSAPDWLADLGGAAVAGGAVAAASDDLPDWMSGLGAETPAAPIESAPVEFAQPTSDDMPDWMSGLGAETPAAPVESAPAEFAQPTSDDLPDWMSGLGAETPAASIESAPAEFAQPTSDDLPDWMSGLGAETPAAPVESAPAEFTQPTSDDLPDWMSGLGAETPAAPAESAPVAAEPASESLPDLSNLDSDDAMAWLEGLAAKHGAKPEELLTRPEDRTDTPPEWVTQAVQTEAPAAAPVPPAPELYQPEKPIEVEAEAPPEELSPLVTGPGTGALDQDESMAWLEGLAAKAGANPEELITAPDARKDAPPDWLGELRSEPDDDLSARVDASAPGVSADDQDASMAWLESLAAKHGANPEELLTAPDARQDTPPDWVTQVVETPAAPEPVASESEIFTPSVEPVAPTAEDEFSARVDASAPGVSADDQDASLAWLESLAAKHGANPEELLTAPDARQDTPPDWVTQVVETPAAPEPVAPEPEIVTPSVEPVAPAAEDEFSARVDASAPGVSADDQDASLAWLESLAAKHGANPEELLTAPDARQDTPPDWVTQVVETPATPEPVASESEIFAPSVEPVAPAAEDEFSARVDASAPGVSADDQDASLAWLESLAAKHGANPEELLTAPDARQDTPPDWVTQVVETPAAPEPVAPEPEIVTPAEEVPPQDDAPAADLDVTPPMFFETPAARDEFSAPSETLSAQPQSVEPVADLNDWLKSLDGDDDGAAQAQEVSPSPWEPIAETPPAPAEQQTPESDISAWINDLQQPADKVDNQPVEVSMELGTLGEGDALPEWLQPEAEEPPATPPPAAPTWVPAEPEPAPAQPEAPKPQPQVVEEPPAPVPQPVAARPVVSAAPGDKDGQLFQTARASLQSGELAPAIDSYAKLIKKGKLIEEIIFDLREAAYRYPVEVSLWQTLGDAYMRANRLQEALDSYTEAERLLH